MRPPDDTLGSSDDLLLDRKRIQDRERQARYHRRQRNGVVIVPVPVDEELLGILATLNWIPERQSTDKKAIARAIIGALKSIR